MSLPVAAAALSPGLWWGEYPDGEFELVEIGDDCFGVWIFGWDVPIDLDRFTRFYEAVIFAPDGKRWQP